MGDIDCPLCGHEYDSGKFPDLLYDLGPDNKTRFECEQCGLEFELLIEFQPVFYSWMDGAQLVHWTDPIA